MLIIQRCCVEFPLRACSLLLGRSAERSRLPLKAHHNPFHQSRQLQHKYRCRDHQSVLVWPQNCSERHFIPPNWTLLSSELIPGKSPGETRVNDLTIYSLYIYSGKVLLLSAEAAVLASSSFPVLNLISVIFAFIYSFVY